MMHVVCIGDVHLAPGEGRAMRAAAVEAIIEKELAHPRGVSLWVVLGDLSHGLHIGRMQPEDRNWWAKQLRVMAQVAPVILPYGNHDIPGDLDLFGLVKARFPIAVLPAPGIVDAKNEAGDVIIRAFVLPYPQKAGQVATGASLEDARQALHTLCVQGAQALLDARDRHVRTLVVGHLNIAGALSSVGQPQIGKEIELDPSALALFARSTPLVFGHIHKAQELAGAYYAGSVCPMDWGETEPKSYLTIDYPDAFEAPPIVRREALSVPRLWHVEGDVVQHTNEDPAVAPAWGFTWQVVGEQATPPDVWTDRDHVRVRYRFPASARDLFPREMITSAFTGAGRVKIEPVAIPDRTTRAPQVAAARTLDDKVLAWAEHARLTLTDAGRQGVQQALHELQAQDRETVIAAVVAQLKAEVGAIAGGAR